MEIARRNENLSLCDIFYIAFQRPFGKAVVSRERGRPDRFPRCHRGLGTPRLCPERSLVMSDSNAVPPLGSPPKKRRSPVERALVWFLIAALLVLVGIESRSRYSYHRAFDLLGNHLTVTDDRI